LNNVEENMTEAKIDEIDFIDDEEKKTLKKALTHCRLGKKVALAASNRIHENREEPGACSN
jgi:hypothetical protein